MTTEEEGNEEIDIRYKNGKIYKIISPSEELLYYGSTIESLEVRFQGHLTKFKKGKEYCTSFEILKFGDAFIELVENFPCNSKKDLERREGFHIRNNDCVNKNIAGRNLAEYYQDNKAELREYGKEYYEKNKGKAKEYRKVYYETHKEEIKEKQKAIYENNKPQILERNKVYRENNKPQILEKKRERYDTFKNNPEFKEKRNEKNKKRYDKIKNNPEYKFKKARNEAIRRLKHRLPVRESTMLKYNINPDEFI